MNKQYWHIDGNALVWNVEKGEAHLDNIEMSGLFCDTVVYYGVKDNGEIYLSQKAYFPMLRTIPNNTHASYLFEVNEEERPYLTVRGARVTEYPVSFSLDGTLRAACRTKEGFTTERVFFPSADKRFYCERLTVIAERDIELSVSVKSGHVHSYGRGTKGVYVSGIYHTAPDVIRLKAKERAEIGIAYTTLISGEKFIMPDFASELEGRARRVKELCDGALVLKTGNEELDTMVRLAKLRAGESVFETLTGKYHSPGGHRYYAATWCNDEVEYAGPHFAMTGDKIDIEASVNAYLGYMPFMSDSYHRIPSSIIAEGLDIWEGAGDRGDAAMYLYGASLFCLYLGDEDIARRLFPAIKWCAEYCERKKTPEGVISSDSDELEGRFPTDGYANLSTSCLCYGGLKSAAKLACSLGEDELAKVYRERAAMLENAIEEYFGAELHGFKTYRYSKGYDTLRAWICLPLCMGITKRKEGTIGAMLSPYLWTGEEMYSCELSEENKSKTIWDRSYLYGIKCAFASGEGDRVMKPFLSYCRKRLLLDRVPYAVEAYPEGDKRHLSAESALLVRVITEGMLSISPEGLDSFSFVPRVPSELDKIELRSVKISGGIFDIFVGKDSYRVSLDGVTVKVGKTDSQRVLIKRLKR